MGESLVTRPRAASFAAHMALPAVRMTATLPTLPCNALSARRLAMARLLQLCASGTSALFPLPAFLMIDHDTAHHVTDASVPSAQCLDDGAPRFRTPRSGDPRAWHSAMATETHGGVQAEIRCFLDAQLDTGDVLLDVGSTFAFVALSAATVPQATTTVLFMHEDAAFRLEVQQAALEAGRWVDVVNADDWGAVRDLLSQRLDAAGRLFVHTSADRLDRTCAELSPLLAAERVLALCVGGANDHEDRASIVRRLDATGYVACQLVLQGEEPILVRTDAWESGDVVALPEALVAPAVATAPTAAPMASDAEWFDDEAGALTLFVPGASRPTAVAGVSAAAEAIVAPAARSAGLSLIAPHSRTGYGIVGANLLRALQQRLVPVAFFPVGPVDPSLTNNAHLQEALDAQDHFSHAAPSVRLFPPSDLALHVGRGPRVGFPIFESTRFSERERHHLQSQDALLVCTPWARQVCVENGLQHVPTHLVPLGVDRAVFHEHVVPTPRSQDTVFLQVGKLETRKGQLELLRAFEAAFMPNDAVRLVLACHNPFVTESAFRAAAEPFRRSPMSRRITLVTQPLPAASDVASLMAGADCGVFTVRAEGWNLEALEMLSLGKAVIATQVTGHTGFLTEQNARLITPHAQESAAAGGLLGEWAAWTSREHEQLVEQLRAVHRARRDGPLPLNVAGLETARMHSWDHSAGALLQALGTL